MDNWNNILKRNKKYIKAKNKINTQVENNILQQLGLTKNLQTLFQPILKSQEDIKKKLEPTPKQIQQPPFPSPHQIEYPIKDDEIIIRTLDDINNYFSNPDPVLPKSISPIVDNQGLLFNGYRIKFNENLPQFKIDTKDFTFTSTKGLIDLMNGGYIDIADYKDLLVYSTFLHAIRKTGPKTRRLEAVETYLNKVIIDKNDYKSVIKNVKKRTTIRHHLK
ncbi:hypothetical protein LOTGIDRAFT_171421 [Lottia gigantea]|uniref:Uncharacterized protein n=1 Tax=Lottia gigantea TaxID=225164 RepID=V4AHG0_LOTGI|nr:hypothetical protein LOTGIDRAFT_171421 [Lottia gigantea]ESP03484.1 hypothetical protein LOTGIDRAFT_171421 [Lottia gigantea]